MKKSLEEENVELRDNSGILHCQRKKPPWSPQPSLTLFVVLQICWTALRKN